MTSHPREHGTVVVGADGSDRGYAGVRYAALEAQRLDVTLDIVHVSPSYLPVGPMLVIPDGSLQSYAASVIDRAAREARAAAPDVVVATHELHGHRVESIVRFAEGAAVLVLGSRHLTMTDRILTGATVAGAVSRATCPTVVIPSTWEPDSPRDRVVVGFKSPRHATELLAAGFALADDLGAELEILHVWKLQGVYDDMIASSVEEEQHSTRELALIEPLLADFRLAYPHVKAYVRVVHRRPAAALVGASARADRLIVSKPAHGARLHHLGGTARALLRDAQCPVEVVAVSHEPDETPDLLLERGGELVPDGAARG